MSQFSIFQNQAFQQTAPEGVKAFNLVPEINNFNSMFDMKPLDKSEANQIEKLLVDNFQLGRISEDQVASDAVRLKQITAEIKAIGKQGTILMGERVLLASEILKPYKDGTFTEWLEVTFGSRKTGYNMLNYFLLYKELPNEELRQKFKKIPQRIAYILASRKNGTLEDKAEIINEYDTKQDLVAIINEKFPLASGDKRSVKKSNDRLILDLREAIGKIETVKDALTEGDQEKLAELLSLLSSICSPRVNQVCP